MQLLRSQLKTICNEASSACNDGQHLALHCVNMLMGGTLSTCTGSCTGCTGCTVCTGGLVVLPQIALLVPALEIKLTTLEPALHPAGGDWEESKQNSALMLTSTKDSWVML